MEEFLRRKMISRLALALILGLGLSTGKPAEAGNGNRAPDVGEYQEINAPAGNKVSFHAYAEGVQIWRWNGVTWAFVGPEAVLYDNDDNIVGSHYGGPTWESNSGSYVVAAVVDRATPNADAIPWLLLAAVDNDGRGIFRRVTYIQRVNTVGGIAPGQAGDFVGQVARVPYSADYYFYRKQK